MQNIAAPTGYCAATRRQLARFPGARLGWFGLGWVGLLVGVSIRPARHLDRMNGTGEGVGSGAAPQALDTGPSIVTALSLSKSTLDRPSQSGLSRIANLQSPKPAANERAASGQVSHIDTKKTPDQFKEPISTHKIFHDWMARNPARHFLVCRPASYRSNRCNTSIDKFWIFIFSSIG